MTKQSLRDTCDHRGHEHVYHTTIETRWLASEQREFVERVAHIQCQRCGMLFSRAKEIRK